MSRASSAIVGLALAVGMSVLAAPPASAAGWLSETEATAGPADAIQGTTTAVAPDGSLVMAWAESSGRGGLVWSVQVATLAPGAAEFSEPVQAAPPGENLTSLGVVVDGTGAVTVSWLRHWEFGRTRVEVARRTAGAARFADPVNVSGPTDNFGFVVGAGDQQGRVTLAWTRIEVVNGVRADWIETNTWEPDLADWSGQLALGTGDTGLPALSVDGAGAVTVAWAASAPSASETLVRSRTRLAGSSSFEPVQTHTPIGDFAGALDLASSAAGGTVLGWGLRGRDHRIQVAVRPRGASAFGDAVDVAETAGFPEPKVAIDDAGTLTVAWAAFDGAPRAMVATAAAGGAFTPGVNVASLAGLTRDLFLTGSGAGAAVLAWSYRWDDASGSRVARAAHRPVGGVFGAPIDLTARVVGVIDGEVTASVSEAGDAFVGWTRMTVADNHRERVFARVLDGTAPVLDGVSVPGTGAAGAVVAVSATATDSWSGPPSVSWDFGDGGSGVGGSSAHVYAAAGSYVVRVSATDGAGNATTRTRTIVVGDATAPVLSEARLTPGRLPTGHGARLRVTSSERAALSGVVQRRSDGRWRGVGAKRWSVQVGSNTRTFYGKTSERRLRSGAYRVRLVATDPAGNASVTTSIRFRVDRG